MQLKLRKIGNSWGVILPKDVVEPFLELGLAYIEVEIEAIEKTTLDEPIIDDGFVLHDESKDVPEE